MMNTFIAALPLIGTVGALFGLVVAADIALALRERVICHYTGKTFVPKTMIPIDGEHSWVACEVCDSEGRVIGEDGYDRTNPAWHAIKQSETAHAGIVNGFGTKEEL